MEDNKPTETASESVTLRIDQDNYAVAYRQAIHDLSSVATMLFATVYLAFILYALVSRRDY